MILLTGGTGFVGHKVARALLDRDEHVRCLARDPARAGTRELQEWGCELAPGDMTDAASLRRAVDGCSVVVHLAAIRQGRREQFERIMSEGTRDLLAAAQEAGVRRFVLMSALGVTDETKDLVPYYRAKWEMEQAVRGSGLEWVAFRPSFIFGRDGGILQTFARLARFSPVTAIPGDGTQRIQPIWVEDVAAFFADGVRSPEAANRLFEVGGPDAVSWREFWARLKYTLGVRRPTVHVPMALMRANALVTERLPGEIPLTRDLLKMLEAGDNTCDVRPAVEAFGLPLMPLDEQLRRATT